MPKTSASSSSIRAVLGSDEAEVKRVAREISDSLSPGGDFGTDILDGVADNADQAVTRIHQTVEAILTMPFFGGKKLVWLRNANFLGDNVMGRSASVQEALEKLVETLEKGLPEGILFLLSATDVDKRRSFYKTLSKLTKVEVYDKLDASRAGWEEEASQFVQKKAQEKTLRFDEDALELFTLLTGGDTRQIQNELEKIDLFLGPDQRKISAELVRTLVPLSRAGVIFELGNAIAKRDLQEGLKLIDQLLYQGESAIGILLVAVTPTVRNLLLVKDLMERNKLRPPQAPFHFAGTLNRLPTDATAHLPRKKDGTLNTYPLGIAACHAHRYKVAELQQLFEDCLQANVQLVTTSLDPRLVLSRLLARLIAGKN